MLLYRHKIHNYREWHAVDTNLWKLYWFGMLNRGVMAQPYWWDEQWTHLRRPLHGGYRQAPLRFEEVARHWPRLSRKPKRCKRRWFNTSSATTGCPVWRTQQTSPGLALERSNNGCLANQL